MCLRIEPHTPAGSRSQDPPRLLCVCSAEENARLRAENAAQGKEIKELNMVIEKMQKLKVKAKPKIAGLYGNDTGTIVRAVYEGTGKNTEKAYFTLNLGGTSKKYLNPTDADNWVVMEEEAVLAAVAAHENNMNGLKKLSPAK